MKVSFPQQGRLAEALKQAAAERDTAAARQEEVTRCKAYIETLEAKLRIHSEYIGQLEAGLAAEQVSICPKCESRSTFVAFASSLPPV